MNICAHHAIPLEHGHCPVCLSEELAPLTAEALRDAERSVELARRNERNVSEWRIKREGLCTI